MSSGTLVADFSTSTLQVPMCPQVGLWAAQQGLEAHPAASASSGAHQRAAHQQRQRQQLLTQTQLPRALTAQ